MKYALDLEVIIHLLTQTPGILEYRNAAVEQGIDFVIPPNVHYEMRCGFNNVNAEAKQLLYQDLRLRCPVGEMKQETWDLATEIYNESRRNKQPTSYADILIAAFCITEGHTLVTTNAKDFANISGLQLADWEV